MLGRLLGEGANSEVYAWESGKAIKLYKAEVNWGAPQYEVWVNRAIYAAGGPAPEIYDVVVIGDRVGIVYPEYVGPDMAKLLITREITPEVAGTELAQLYHSLHVPGYKVPLRTFRDWASTNISVLRSKGLPADISDKLDYTLMQLPEGDTLCHADLHPGNVIRTSEGLRIIDWAGAIQGVPMVDVSRFHLNTSLFILDPSSVGMEQSELDGLLSALGDAFMRGYAALSDIPVAALHAKLLPYNVVMAGMRMTEGTSSEEEKRVIMEYIRRA